MFSNHYNLCLKMSSILTTVIFIFALTLNVLQLNASQSGPRVIVIGAGVAGLIAGSQLHQAGFNVTLLEISGRIGGRTLTWKTENGEYFEVGGEHIHGQVGNPIFELVNPLGLVHTSRPNKPRSLLEYGDTFGFQTGKMLNSTLSLTLFKLLEYIWDDNEGWGEDFPENISVGDAARLMLQKFNEEYPFHDDARFLEAVLDWAHRSTNAEESSTNWFDISNSDEGEQYILPEGDPAVRWKPPYSYSSLHQLILTGNVTEDGVFPLPEWIVLNNGVEKIEYSTQAETVNVVTKGGMNYTADHVIFTPSLGILKAHHESLFDPVLSQKKQLAIENIGFGAVSKLFYKFETPWWPVDWAGLNPLWNDHDYTNKSLEYWREDITREELLQDIDGLPLWCRSILTIYTVDSGSAPSWMRVWISGLPSLLLDSLEEDYIQENVMKTVRLFLDKQFNITEPISRFKSNWGSNENFLGTYSFRKMITDEVDVWARDLEEPFLTLASQKPVLCFAGEATHRTFFSTVHAAYESGLRESQRIQDWHQL